jgi:hypothetical protein
MSGSPVLKASFSTRRTIYVLIGKEDANEPVRYFIVRNRDVAGEVSVPSTWKTNDSAFMMLKSLRPLKVDGMHCSKKRVAIRGRPRLAQQPRADIALALTAASENELSPPRKENYHILRS